MKLNFTTIIRFFIFIILQVFLFNNIQFYGFLNPYPYILFIILYPLNSNKHLFLLSSFLIGLSLDMFFNSGGIHALASTFLAYLRPTLMRFSFGISYEYQTIKVGDKISSERISLLLASIIIHHTILFTFEYFRFDLFLTIISKIFLTSIISFLFCILIIYLLKPSKNRR